MSILMDPLVKRMVKYFDKLLREVDDNFPRQFQRVIRVRVMLRLLQTDELVKPKMKGLGGGLLFWTATKRLRRMVGGAVTEARPYPLGTFGLRGDGPITTRKEQRYWDYCSDHLWIFQRSIYDCIDWIGDDRRLANLCERLRSGEAQEFVKFIRRLMLSRSLKLAAREAMTRSLELAVKGEKMSLHDVAGHLIGKELIQLAREPGSNGSVKIGTSDPGPQLAANTAIIQSIVAAPPSESVD